MKGYATKLKTCYRRITVSTTLMVNANQQPREISLRALKNLLNIEEMEEKMPGLSKEPMIWMLRLNV